MLRGIDGPGVAPHRLPTPRGVPVVAQTTIGWVRCGPPTTRTYGPPTHPDHVHKPVGPRRDPGQRGEFFHVYFPYPSSRTSAMWPAMAAAAAMAGLIRWVRPPRPWRPSKLRFEVAAQRSPG